MRIRDEYKELSIKKSALEMVVKQGIDGLSMQRLAKLAGVSPATIYIYFKDREDLLLQIALEENKKMSDATLINFNPEMHFADGLRIQWMNRAKYCMENQLSMEFWEQLKHTPLYEKIFENMDSGFMNAMKKFVHNAIERKELVRVPVEVYWSIAFAPLYQLVKFHIQGKSFRGSNNSFSLSEDMMMQALELVIKGLTP